MGSPPLGFGTDGIRGPANTSLTPELALAVGRAAGQVLGRGDVVIGHDGRRSGPLVESAVAAGLAAEGRDVVRLGMTTTPALAWVAGADRAAGVVVSASHNPFSDNGIKVFDVGGHKLDDERQAEVARAVAELYTARPRPRLTGADVGVIVEEAWRTDRYVDHVLGCLDGRTLDGTSLVVDCAHGAASTIAPIALARSGAVVHVIGADPNGTNINDGVGSTSPEALAEEVLARGAALGLALDGDADRLVAVDETGHVVDGDHLMALFAVDLAERGRLVGDTVVVTVMSNLGLHRAMDAAGITLIETPVGDRHVLAALDAGGFVLGGEQSGHLVFRDLATTGDGLLSGVLLADLVRRAGEPLSVLARRAMTTYPQVLVNVAAPHADVVLDDVILEATDAASSELGERGRVLVRASGTEALVRVMVEAETVEGARSAAEALADQIARHLT